MTRLKRRVSVVWLAISCVLLVVAFANWIWIMATYEATTEELLMIASLPNQAMFGALLSVAAFGLSVHAVAETKGDPDEQIEKGIRPVLRAFWQECRPEVVLLGKLLVVFGATIAMCVLVGWLLGPKIAMLPIFSR